MSEKPIYPANPTQGQEFTVGQTIKVWDGEKWVNKSFGNHEKRLRQLEETKNLTTVELINSSFEYLYEGDSITTVGFYESGDGGDSQWVKTSDTGTPSQTPAQLGDAKFTDSDGAVWELVSLAGTSSREVNILSLGGLSDTSKAIQASLGSVTEGDSVVINIPSGDFLLDEKVTKVLGGNIHVRLKGSGSTTTRLLINNPDGGIDIETTQRTTRVDAEGMAFVVDGNVTDIGFRFAGVEGGNQNERRGYYSDLYIGTNDMFTGGNINNPFEASGIFRPLIDNVIIISEPEVTNTGIGLNINGTYKAHIENSYVNGDYAIGVSDQGVEGEGGYITESTVNGSYTGYKRIRDNLEPEFWVNNCHFNCRTVGVEVENCKYVWLTNNLMYTSANEGDGYVDFKINSGYQYIIKGNTYRQPFDSTRVHISLNTTGVLEGVTISGDKLSATAALYVFANSLVSELEIFESNYTSTESFVSYPTGFDRYDIRTVDAQIHRGFDSYSIANNSVSSPKFGKYRDSSSPEVNDSLSEDISYGRNSAGEWINYSNVKTVIVNPNDGDESGRVEFYTQGDGSVHREAAMGNGISIGGNIYSPGVGYIAVQNGYVIRNGVTWTSGPGSPEGVLSAPVGSIYSRENGGAGSTLYVKESGSSNTGWVAK